MNMAEVLDAHALMVYLEREEGFDLVKSLFCFSALLRFPETSHGYGC